VKVLQRAIGRIPRNEVGQYIAGKGGLPARDSSV